MEKMVDGIVFRIILTVFSCVFLVFSMLCTVRLAAMNDRAAETTKQIEELSTENNILLARYESSIGLSDIEEYATEILGMQKCAPEQIVYLDTPEISDVG